MPDSSEPLYMQIYGKLFAEIQAGEYGNNQKLPTEMELSQIYHVSRITSKKALDMLAENKIVVRIKGKGSYVSPNWNEKKNNAFLREGTGKKVIGVIMPDFSDSYGIELFLSIERSCKENGYYCLFCRSNGDQRQEEKAISEMMSFRVDGIIIMPVHGKYYNAKILRLILDGFPIVVIDRDLRGIPSHFVGTDNISAAEKGMDFLFQSGHKIIGVYSPNTLKTSSLEDRIKGINRSLQNMSIPINPSLFFTEIDSTLPSNNTPEAFAKDRIAIMEHIRKSKGMTAAFALEYNIALIVKSAVKELGLSVPKDISIMCFDSPENAFSHSISPAFEYTHIRQKQEEMGKQSFDLVLSLIRGDAQEKSVKIYLDSSLENGKSTRNAGTVKQA